MVQTGELGSLVAFEKPGDLEEKNVETALVVAYVETALVVAFVEPVLEVILVHYLAMELKQVAVGFVVG